MQRFIYGKKSEKLPVADRQLAFEDLEGALAAVEGAAPPRGEPPAPPAAPLHNATSGTCLRTCRASNG